MIKWLSMILVSFSVFASPVAELHKQGEGEMTYLFWTLYRAEYFSGSPSDTGGDPTKALRITYNKPISRQALLDATHEQWSKLGYADSQVSGWLASLSVIWPDVEPGDQLIVLVTTGGTSEFYLSDEMIGSIADDKFGDAFLSIWLSERTSQPALRLQLLGKK
jgi:hypothetical protein